MPHSVCPFISCFHSLAIKNIVAVECVCQFLYEHVFCYSISLNISYMLFYIFYLMIPICSPYVLESVVFAESHLGYVIFQKLDNLRF